MPDLTPIKTIVIVMMENRSFDHMLGYLSLPPSLRSEVDGLQEDPSWRSRYANFDRGYRIMPFLSEDPHTMPASFDPPHERPNIAAQMDPLRDRSFAMTGFVSAIPDDVSADPQVRRLVLSHFGPEQAPMTDFLAANFAICDRYFSSLPAGTQPNRLMAMAGFSGIDLNSTLIPEQELVYDWLTRHGIRWRVYHQGLPFFALMPTWIPEMLLSDRFRDFEDMASDLVSTPPDELPQVIFVEPVYEDSPHLGFSTDDHAPSGISNGQEFLMRVYNAISTVPEVWLNSVMIITYDEHGGFFDHVAPPALETVAPPGASYPPFETLGVRVPAYIVSPFAKSSSVCHQLFDHTSILKLLGDKFGGGSYSDTVDRRPVRSLAEALDFSAPITHPPAPPSLEAYLKPRPEEPSNVTPPKNDNNTSRGFSNVVRLMKNQGAGPAHEKFGDLLT